MSLERLLELGHNDKIELISQNLCERIATKLECPKSYIPMDSPLQLEGNSTYLGHPKYKISPLLAEQMGSLVLEWFGRKFEVWELFPNAPGTPAFNTIYRAAEQLVADMETTSIPESSFNSPYGSGTWNWGAVENTNETVENKIVFVVSPPRTGTTLLRLMLEGNPRLFAPPELFLLQCKDMGSRHHHFERLEYFWMHQGHVDALASLFSTTGEEAQQHVDRLCSEDVSIASVYEEIQERLGDRILVDKTALYPISYDCLTRSLELFPNARYIVIKRHPYPVIQSLVRMRLFSSLLRNDWGCWDANQWLCAEKWWGMAFNNLLKFSNVVGENIHWISFEELVVDPSSVLKGICNFLEIPFAMSMLSPYQGDRMRSGLGDPNQKNRNSVQPELASITSKNKPPQQLSPFTIDVALQLGYNLF